MAEPQAKTATTMPPAESFPLDVLPEAVAEFVRVTASSIGCAPDFVALPVLVVAAGAIGRSVVLSLKSGYSVTASLYAACVSPPSEGKTPALKAAVAPIRRIDRDLADAHKAEMERLVAESTSRAPGPPPRPQRIVVDDVTLEALHGILADNPRGLLMIRDDLSALTLGMNQYKPGGKDSDWQSLLKLWSGDDIIRDRLLNLDRTPLRCKTPCLSIVGPLEVDDAWRLIGYFKCHTRRVRAAASR